MSASAETLRLLTSIDATLKALLAAQSGQASPAPTVDLDGPHGDPVVKAKDPRNWTGEPMRGRTFSQCPPEYLDQLADRYDFFAGKEDSTEKDRKYARLDGARARGWAARLRGGWTRPESDSAAGDPVTDWNGASAENGGPQW